MFAFRSMRTAIMGWDRDGRSIALVAILALSGGIMAGVGAYNSDPGPHVDPATTPDVQARIAACVSAKPEIEAWARHEHSFGDADRLLYRIEGVHAADPTQCGELVEKMRRDQEQIQWMMIAGAAAS
jgi:hypothetical protein